MYETKPKRPAAAAPSVLFPASERTERAYKCGFVNSRRSASHSGAFAPDYLHFTAGTMQTAGNSEKLRTMSLLGMTPLRGMTTMSRNERTTLRRGRGGGEGGGVALPAPRSISHPSYPAYLLVGRTQGHANGNAQTRCQCPATERPDAGITIISARLEFENDRGARTKLDRQWLRATARRTYRFSMSLFRRNFIGTVF